MDGNFTPMDKDQLSEGNARYNLLTQAADLWRIANTILPQFKDEANIEIVKGLISNLQPYYETHETARNKLISKIPSEI